MRERIVSILAVLLLATLALGSYWLAQRARLGLPDAAKPIKHEPDYFAEQFLLHRLNTTGQVESRLKADHMVHYPDDNTSVLSSNVLVERSGDAQQAPLQVRTEKATVQHDQEIILSSDLVRATQGNSSMTGIGMRMDTAARNLHMQQDVHTTWTRP